MVGLGPPPPAAWAVAAPAGPIWLAETSRPATARTTAISTIRILERRMPWMMFTAVFLPDGATWIGVVCRGRECWPRIGGAGLRLIIGAPGGSLPSEPGLYAIPR